MHPPKPLPALSFAPAEFFHPGPSLFEYSSFKKEFAQAGRAASWLIAVAVALFLAPELSAQQPQYQGQYGDSYAPQPQSGYGQPSYPEPQPGYGQQEQDNAQPQPYAEQPYAEPTYPVPSQSDDQAEEQQDSGQPQPLNAEDLEQMVAPIALYPDALLAQVLAASTYPAQVEDADHWLRAQGYASSDQIAAAADAQPWDPSVKALTAFPQVLALMDENLHWTSELGDAYYNQSQDLLEAVQVMRQRAQQAGNLNNTPQESMSYDQGNIVLAPANPQMVYVPAYNPWSVYGESVSPYPGFSLVGALGSFFGSSAVRFGLGVAMTAFTHTPWGFLGWGLNWLTQSVLFNGSNYYSHSNTVADWGLRRGGPGAFSRGGAFANGSHGAYRPGYGRQGGYGWNRGGYQGVRAPGFARMPNRDAYARNGGGERYGRGYQTSGSGYGRSSSPGFGGFRPALGRSPQYGRSAERPGFHGSSFQNRIAQNYGSRGGTGYGSWMRASRSPGASFQRSGFGREASHGLMSSSRGSFHGSFHESSHGFMGNNFSRSSGKQGHSGGSSHRFGGGHAPKSFGGGRSFGHGHSGGGGHSHGGGHSGGGKHHR